MLIWCEDKELSKYSRYKAKVDLTKIGTSSERARWGSVEGRCTRSRVSVLALHAFSDGASRELSQS